MFYHIVFSFSFIIFGKFFFGVPFLLLILVLISAHYRLFPLISALLLDAPSASPPLPSFPSVWQTKHAFRFVPSCCFFLRGKFVPIGGSHSLLPAKDLYLTSHTVLRKLDSTHVFLHVIIVIDIDLNSSVFGSNSLPATPPVGRECLPIPGSVAFEFDSLTFFWDFEVIQSAMPSRKGCGHFQGVLL